MAAPASLPPVTRPATAPFIPFASKTLETILVTATAQRGVLGDGFQSVAFPAAIESARFLNQYRIQCTEIKTKIIEHEPAIDGDREVESGQDSHNSEGIRN